MPIRPDPDALLTRAKQAAAARARGRLRIYFGASAGVGKTYAMLQEARRVAREGRDVVVGIVETHGRVDTEALLGDDEAGPAPPVLPRAHRLLDGRSFDEFDLDGALVRKPQLILVDELAHSNAPGSRHPKRWQDVDELLSAGIDVFTTLNVQHLESLNDVVGGITGIRVRETIPDTFFDRADEVVLVDVPADELLKRLAAGKVYLPAQAERAARNFFRKGNLIALREIALRRTARRVEGDVQAYRDERAIGAVWATEAALLCCVGPDAGAERVVRAAARLAGQLDVAWQALYVETPRLQRRAAAERDRILRVLALAQQLGATTSVVAASDIADAIAGHARRHNLSRLVVGRGGPRVGAFAWWPRPPLVSRIAEAAPELDVVVVGDAHDAPAEPGAARPAARALDDEAAAPAGFATRLARRRGFVEAALAVALVTGAAMPLATLLHPTNIAMIYLLAVTVVAMRSGRGPAAFAAVVAVAAFDFFFVPPRYSFAVADVQYVVTLATMLTVALVIGRLAADLRYQARVAGHREERARSLYEIARELSRALRTEDVTRYAGEALGKLFHAEATVLLPPRVDAADAADDARRQRLVIDAALERASGFEPAIAQWSFEQGQPAGAGTDTLSGSAWLFLPLATPIATRGVLALRPTRRRLLMIPEQRRFLETLATLIGIAIERVHYVEVAQDAIVRIESEHLRNSILSALSHDLRTPIAALAGLTETLAMTGAVRVDRPLIQAMRDEVHRMGALVENLLDMARIESGDVTLKRGWHLLEETIGAALAACGRELSDHRIETSVPNGLPLVEYDAVLIERVLDNLLQNASKYAPPGSTVLVEAWSGPGTASFAVEDDGPGPSDAYVADGSADALFDKFVRGVDESATTGVGLGLAICRAIVEAHGGTIVVDASRHLPASGRRGFRVTVTLPRAEAPPVDEAAIIVDAADAR